jgi:hypothetical protein
VISRGSYPLASSNLVFTALVQGIFQVFFT